MATVTVTENATVDEIDEALTLLAAGLATGSEDYRKVALTYADELLDRRLALPQK